MTGAFGDIVDIVDTDRYPLDEPADPRRRSVVDRARAELRADGATVLRDVIRAERRDELRAQGVDVAPHAHQHVADVTVYNTDPDADLPPEHPAAIVLQRRNAFVPRDHIPADHLIQRLYTSAPFRSLLADCVELDEIHELADPFAGLCLNVVAPGDHHPWHFDTNEIAVSLLTQAPDDGGAFEYCPGIRSVDDEHPAAVRAVLDGADDRVRRLTLRPGDLQIFRGRFSLHRVTTVHGRTARHSAIFAYSTRPGVVGSPTRTRQLFGRVAPEHETEPRRRADALRD